MRRVAILICGLSILGASCSPDGGKNKTVPVEKKQIPATSIEFAESEHDFGKITEGEKVSHVFKFKNTGANPLVVSQVQPSCGCTAPDWTTEPVAPGAEGSVHVLFNSQGREGKQHKSVTVVSNTTPATNQLLFTAEVLPKKK